MSADVGSVPKTGNDGLIQLWPFMRVISGHFTGIRMDYALYKWGHNYLKLVKGHNCIKSRFGWIELADEFVMLIYVVRS